MINPFYLCIFSCSLSDFKDYVRQMAADSDFKYAEQFEVRQNDDIMKTCPCVKMDSSHMYFNDGVMA